MPNLEKHLKPGETDYSNPADAPAGNTLKLIREAFLRMDGGEGVTRKEGKERGLNEITPARVW